MKVNIDLVKTALARHPLIVDTKNAPSVGKTASPSKALDSVALGVIKKGEK